jgi:hypothetical protein
MEFLSGLFLGLLSSPITFLVLFAFALVSEYIEWESFGVFLWTLFLGVMAYNFNIFSSWITTISYIVSYIVIGIIWSFYRYSRYLKDADVEALIKRSSEYVIAKLSPANMIGKIIRWIYVWPISFICNFTRGIYDVIEFTIKKYFIGIYDKIYYKMVTSIVESTNSKKEK